MELEDILKKYWGFDSFLPLQKEAMNCILKGRDSLVVLPTGGGKSLCFQAPAMAMEGLAVIISPLISLMKDQVDALTSVGIDAAFLNSSLDYDEQRAVKLAVRDQQLKILYVAPERLVMDEFISLLQQVKISFFAVDEAHCISMWGHDFRPEYRALKVLRRIFPETAAHAYTATATEQVRDDIRKELNLYDAETLVGLFDRPNLIYKVERRSNRMQQVKTVLDQHRDESCIIYCIRRKDVDSLALSLAAQGHKALPYHAGLSDTARKENQDAFLKDRASIIVATVAFGMGIDKSNVRCVIHCGAPKSLEHYQQETGRAGRDDLEAECRLFYSGSDFITWGRFIDEMQPEAKATAQKKLNDIYSYCTSLACRHQTIVNYFGQSLDKKNCEACDVCMGELNLVEDPLVISQKIISCVVRLHERFGAHYTASVLSGSKDKRILEQGHDQLSTWGILSEDGQRAVRDWVEQLVDQEYLVKTGDFNLLCVSPMGWKVLRGQTTPRLLKPAEKKKSVKASKVSLASWEDVDRELFDILRTLRLEKAQERGVPAYVVFGDAALRDMARRLPTDPEQFLLVHGVGQKKCDDFGADFLKAINVHIQANKNLDDIEPDYLEQQA